jgi:hypothetical protein
MSLRDDIFVDEEGREEAEAVTSLYAKLADATDAPFGAQMVLAAAVVAEVLLLAATFLGMRYLHILLNLNIVLFFLLGLFAAFTIGFFLLFSAYKIYKNEISPDEDVRIDSGLMSGFQDEENSRKQFAGWLFGAAGAMLNTVIWLGLLVANA